MANTSPYLGLLEPISSETFSLDTYNNNNAKIDTFASTTDSRIKGDNVLPFYASYAWTGGQAWDAGPLAIDTGAAASSQMGSPQPTFAAAGSLSGAIKVTQPGIYDFIWLTVPQADPGAAGFTVTNSSTLAWPGPLDSENGYFGRDTRIAGAFYWEKQIYALGVRVPTANLEVRFTGQVTNSVTIHSHVKVIQRVKF